MQNIPSHQHFRVEFQAAQTLEMEIIPRIDEPANDQDHPDNDNNSPDDDGLRVSISFCCSVVISGLKA